jgi:hypothetical protein
MEAFKGKCHKFFPEILCVYPTKGMVKNGNAVFMNLQNHIKITSVASIFCSKLYYPKRKLFKKNHFYIHCDSKYRMLG